MLRAGLRKAKHFLSGGAGIKIPSTFYQEKFIFIHIPKCAGSSFFLNSIGYQVGHYSYSQYEKILKKNIIDYTVFSIVRNPLDRFISAYTFIMNGGMNESDQKTSALLKSHQTVDGFLNYLETIDDDKRPTHFKTQFYFLRNRAGNLNLSFVLRQDQLESESIEKNAFMPPKIKKLLVSVFCVEDMQNKSIKNSFVLRKEDLSADELSKIKSIYNKDYWVFGFND